MTQTNSFFKDIQSFGAFDRLFEPANMHNVPGDWYVIVADVQGSTKAVNEGRYKDVNIVGASCIIAVLNVLEGEEIPYVFGGDGASFVVPASVMKQVAGVLCGTKAMARDVYGLDLLIGAIPIEQVYAEGRTLKVSKYQVSDAVSIAMFHGGGLGYAEDCIKSDRAGALYGVERWLDEGEDIEADFSGLECRWDPVKTRKDKILTLMILSRQGDQVYMDAMRRISEIYPENDFSPVRSDALKLSLNAKTLSHEYGLQTYKQGAFQRGLYAMKMAFENILGIVLLKFDLTLVGFEGAKYAQDVVANTDFQKFDDTLRMVLDSSNQQVQELTDYLDAAYQRGELFYGLSSSDSAMLTCLIFEREENHLHFVDGQAGGYTMAAKAMKQQIADDPERGDHPEEGVRA